MQCFYIITIFYDIKFKNTTGKIKMEVFRRILQGNHAEAVKQHDANVKFVDIVLYRQ
jgi:hypothetical protein